MVGLPNSASSQFDARRFGSSDIDFISLEGPDIIPESRLTTPHPRQQWYCIFQCESLPGGNLMVIMNWDAPNYSPSGNMSATSIDPHCAPPPSCDASGFATVDRERCAVLSRGNWSAQRGIDSYFAKMGKASRSESHRLLVCDALSLGQVGLITHRVHVAWLPAPSAPAHQTQLNFTRHLTESDPDRGS